MAPNGFAIAGWVEGAGTNQSAIRVATRPPGGPWSAPQQLDQTSLRQTTYAVSVAVDSAGDAAIAWDDEQLGMQTVDTTMVTTKTAGQATFAAPQALTGKADPVLGIDSTGRVTMLDEELDGSSRDEVDRVWQAGGAPSSTRTDLLATGCRPDLEPSVLAEAPSGAAIVGVDCGGATFIRRISGSWQSPATPISNFFNAGDCAVSEPSTSLSTEAMTVGIDEAGDVAGAFVVDSSSTDCTTSFASDSYSLDLVVGGGTGVVLHSPAVDTAVTMDFTTGSSISSPQIAVGTGEIVLGWRNGSLILPSTDKLAQFNALGQQTATQSLVTASFGSPLSVAMNSSGAAIVAYTTADGHGLQAEFESPDAQSFGAAVPLATPAASPSVAIDDAGDGLAAYTSNPGSAAVAQVRGLDANPPAIGTTVIPSSAVAGTPATFTAQATDMWGPVTVSWDFGDGSASGTGSSVTHTFAAAGTRTVTVTASDAVGNVASATGTVDVVLPTPVISKASIKPGRFKVGHRATLTFTLSEPASVTVALAHRRPVKHHKARFAPAGKLTAGGQAGANHVRFTGRIGKHRLSPGRYRATITATAGRAKSEPVTLGFTILRPG